MHITYVNIVSYHSVCCIQNPQGGGGLDDVDSPVNISEIEERVRSETEARLRREFEEQQQKLINEQQQRLKQEQADLEDKIRREAEETMKRQLREKEEALARLVRPCSFNNLSQGS